MTKNDRLLPAGPFVPDIDLVVVKNTILHLS